MSEYMITASGIHHYCGAFESLGRRRSEYWSLSDNALAAKYPDGEKRIYAYSFPAVTCELVPEPDNPHDPNAIKVLLDGHHVGYVPTSECAAVHSILRRATGIRATVGKGPCKVISDGAVRHYDDEFYVRVTIEYDGKPVTRSSGGSVRAKPGAAVILQWIAAGLLLIFGLAMLPSFASVLFILAAVLAAPIRPLRDLLARYRVRPWMLWISAAVLTVLAFIVSPGSPS